MKFSIVACSTTMLAVFLSAIVSFTEGTLIDGKVAMGFVCHGGMWGDLLIMSTVTGLVIPHLIKNAWATLVSALLAISVTVVMHHLWATHTHNGGATGHMFPASNTGIWYLDLSRAGWMHVMVMAGLLTIVFMYILSPLPSKAILTVSVLLSAHVLLAMAQPAWHATRALWAWQTIGPPLLTASLIWMVAVVKVIVQTRKTVAHL